MSKRIGYARVSTDDQNLDLQRDALTSSGCVHIYEETVSGKLSQPVADAKQPEAVADAKQPEHRFDLRREGMLNMRTSHRVSVLCGDAGLQLSMRDIASGMLNELGHVRKLRACLVPRALMSAQSGYFQNLANDHGQNLSQFGISEILIRSESTWHYSENIFDHSPVKECEFCEKKVPPQF